MSRSRWIAVVVAVLFVMMGASFAFSVSGLSGPSPLQKKAEKAPFEVDERIHAPVRLSGEAPSYTEAARKERIEGIVRLRAIIDEEGRVESLEALEGLSHGLTEAAMDAIREWRFEPAKLEGEPVSVFFELTVNFRLEKHPKEGA